MATTHHAVGSGQWERRRWRWLPQQDTGLVRGWTYVHQAVEGLVDDLNVIDSDAGDAVVPELFPTDDAVPI